MSIIGSAAGSRFTAQSRRKDITRINMVADGIGDNMDFGITGTGDGSEI